MTPMPAVSLAAVPGRRRATLELARRIEELGFTGIWCPSFGDGLALCQGIASVTREIVFGTSIQPIYTRRPSDFAGTTAFIHELSGGRFRFGIGVSHVPALARMGIEPGKPLGDMREFVDAWRATERVGEQPPVVLATLRRRMIALADEIGDGMVFANGARSHMGASLATLSAPRRDDTEFFIGNMIPTCISDDEEAAKAVNRRTLTGYAMLPNYRNYWKEAGYEEEMNAVEAALEAREPERIASCLSDRWLADTTLFGSAAKVREGVEAWFDAGVRTPILVPSSAAGNQLKAFEELFETFA
ncbi:MAG TPA: LLM class flavin-dependent oxidoreductase [Pseudomonadales bacterium]|nr:LLM class flavin-dependent oxidoreductase [Pseudomonadales bacterium]